MRRSWVASRSTLRRSRRRRSPASAWLARAAEERPTDTFFLFKGRAFTYAESNARVTNVVKGLYHVGVRPGDRVLVLMDSRPSYLSMATALVRLGAWSSVEARLARSDNVRTALTFVARGEAPIGIVYATDARAEAKVRAVGEFPAGSYPPIRYPVAALRGANGSGLLQFLRTPTARALFLAAGFDVIDAPDEAAVAKPTAR